MSANPLRVGDLVTVAKASGVNAANARAIVVEAYQMLIHVEGRRTLRPGWMLLFADGRHDGFSPKDCEFFGVVKIGHAPSVADYQFRNVTQLSRDWHAGRFAEAFTA
jgi:hypothetical protein